jgi:hypothetical protein
MGCCTLFQRQEPTSLAPAHKMGSDEVESFPPSTLTIEPLVMLVHDL